MRMLSNLFKMCVAFFFISCQREAVESPTIPPTPVIQLTKPPNVFAGSDIYMVLPVNSCVLNGSAQYPEIIKTSLWKKISGPASFSIAHPSSFETKVYNFVKGHYLFELTVTDKAGLKGKDTVSVSVLEEGTAKNEIVFKDRQWSCPMGCHIRIENFDAIVPSHMAFKVYLKRDHSTQWVEVVNVSQGWSKYTWTIYNKGLEILEDQTENPEDTPDIKIVF